MTISQSVWKIAYSLTMILTMTAPYAHGGLLKDQNTTKNPASMIAPLVSTTLSPSKWNKPAPKLKKRIERIPWHVPWIARLMRLTPNRRIASAHGSSKKDTARASTIVPM